MDKNYEEDIFSLANLKCSQCGSKEYRPKGIQGYNLRSILHQIGFRFFMQTDFTDPVEYKCLKCGKKIIGLPRIAEEDEIIENPCVIKLTRDGSFIGAMVNFTVFLNGKKVAIIGNKQTIEIETYIKNNLLYLLDDSGVAFKNYFNFEVVSGGTKELNWNR